MAVASDVLRERFKKFDFLKRMKQPRYRFVYILLCRGEVVYVGSTVNLDKRIRQHYSQGNRSYAPRKNFDEVLYFRASYNDSTRIEGALTRRFCPKYCGQAPYEGPHGDAYYLKKVGIEFDADSAAKFRADHRTKMSRAQITRARIRKAISEESA